MYRPLQTKGGLLLASVLFTFLFFCLGPNAGLEAQNTSAALTGTVADSSGAVVPNATVEIRNEASGDVRRSVSNSEGFFSISAIQPGSYVVFIEAKGFNKWERKGLNFDAGDRRNLSDISLTIGSAAETVVVEAQADITPVDSGEKSEVISTKQLQNIAIVGSNAAEFIKILPGFAITGGAQNQASFTGETHGTGSGPIGSFSANGQRSGALDITSDGAHIIDPGCNCGQAIDTNVDMTQELKVSTSNFGADAQKGPIVIAAVGKSGGSAFHGQAYLYARDASMNANDSLNNAQGRNVTTGLPVAGRPDTRYLYPGGNIGGPVLIPGTHFNHGRDKLFFFFGYEYYKQTVDNGLYQAYVPTVAERMGDFSNVAGTTTSASGSGVTGTPTKYGITNGIVPANAISPVGQALINLYPLPNVNPQTNNGFNYVSSFTKPQNAYQLRPRVDWSISDNTKLFVTYNRQRDTSYYTDTLWWRPSPTVPYPSRLISSTMSDSVSVNLTKVFSPTLTNEFVFTYTNLNLPFTFENPSKVDPATLGAAYKNIFGSNTKEIPSLTGWGNGFANLIQPSGFQVTGALGAKKGLPTIADNVSKVWGTHTMKFGFYWEATGNVQPSSNNANGEFIFATWGGNSTGNTYADLLTGHLAQYTESNKDVLLKMKYHSVDFYATDSWKVTRRLTVDYGMRFSHLGPWVDQNGIGLAVFDRSKYSNDPAQVNNLTGVEWHKIDSSVPLSGSSSRFLYFNPRVGMAYDVFGNAKTVVRGGWGQYRFHDEQNVQSGALGITQGSFNYTASNVTIDQIGAISAGFVAPGGITVLDRKDNQQPLTTSYSFTISQRAPWASLFEASYVGNQSSHLSNWNNNFGQINDIGYGTLFNQGGLFTAANNYSPGSSAENALRPFTNYQTIKVINHQMYSNYNGLQMSWNKQSGHINFLANYTFSKALGVRGESGSATGDPTNLRNNYGVLPNDRTHIFNVAYVIQMPSPIKSNAILKGAVNGWQVSGITQVQSGVNIQAAVTSNFSVTGNLPAGSVLPDGTVLTKSTGISSDLINGTPDINVQPVLTCDPTKGLAKNQFINGSCFALPTPGHNGPFILPYLRGPAFINSDLSLFKNFNFGESKKLQFRASAYNFLNHPLTSFINGDPNFNLSFDSNGKIVNPNFGYANNKIGHRIIQLALKFYF